MATHRHRRFERRCDVAVVGGSAAGLAAALQLGRQRRRVIVVDAGEPRNAPAEHVHGVPGHDGRPPAELVAIAREEVRSYGGEVVPGRAVDVVRLDDGGFRVELAGDQAIRARRVLAATGLVDVLPAIDGVAEQWGRGVIHCPFCHGFEARDHRIVQILTHPLGLHQATMFHALTDRHTLVLHDGVAAGDPDLAVLRAAGVTVVDRRARRVVVEHGAVVAVELDDGTRLDADVVVVGGRFEVRDAAFRSLGVELVEHASGLGRVVVADGRGATSVPGLYAAGNLVDPGHQVLHAASHGSWVGAMISADLAHEDVAAASRPSANEADWDHRYSADQVWSGNPNGTLVAEVGTLAPGRALDVGAGEGGDAVWLAEHGWDVTANDISRRALDRIAAAAASRGVRVALSHADVNAPNPFGAAAFDLVSAQYASILRTPDGRAIRTLLDAVAPGGTLVVVGHDLEPMRAPIDTRSQSRAFDPDAYVRVDDVAAALAGSPDWEIEVHEVRPRPPGAASSHHVDDVVLRARRRPLASDDAT